MIYTITPNPALDLGGTVDDLVPNEKMYVYNETRFPGGNGINAARVISALGVSVRATGFLGGGTGDEIKDLLKNERVPNRFVSINGHTRTSITVLNKRSRLQTRLSFPGPRIRKAEIESLFSYLSKSNSNDIFVIGGSLPPGFPTSNLIALLRLAERQSIPCIVDVPGRHLGAVVRQGALLIKPNLVEFQKLVGRKIFSRSAVLAAARDITPRVSLVCVSSVEGGALLVTKGAAWFGKGPQVRVRSQVGAGDSMVGAMAAELSKMQKKEFNWAARQGDDWGDLLRWGLSSAMAKLINPGTKLGSRKQMRSFYPKIQIERLE